MSPIETILGCSSRHDVQTICRISTARHGTARHNTGILTVHDPNEFRLRLRPEPTTQTQTQTRIRTQIRLGPSRPPRRTAPVVSHDKPLDQLSRTLKRYSKSSSAGRTSVTPSSSMEIMTRSFCGVSGGRWAVRRRRQRGTHDHLAMVLQGTLRCAERRERMNWYTEQQSDRYNLGFARASFSF